MIKLRLNSIMGDDEILEYLKGENVKDSVSRAILGKGFSLDSEYLRDFIVIFNGHPLDSKLWVFVNISEYDEVLIAPKLRSGDSGGIFKSIALITIMVLAAPAVAAWAGGSATIGFGLGMAAVSIGSSLALNALIPPPSPDLGGVGFGSGGYSSSQMFSITSQSNSIKKYGYVPKVYGTHRMFPIVAANPYTEIEADPETGKLIQFFYAIYDFGLGPLAVSDIKLGETPISNFFSDPQKDSSVGYRLVDLNRPAVDEGDWDSPLRDSFIYYKGDNQTDGTIGVLNKNSNDLGAVLSEYEIVRNASSLVEGSTQEISLDFVNPQGLISYGTNGGAASVSIELEIYFSRVGEDIWRAYNDLDYVSSFKSVGGYEGYVEKLLANYPMTSTPSSVFSQLRYVGRSWLPNIYKDGTSGSFPVYTYGFIPSSTSVIFGDGAEINDYLFSGEITLGKVISKALYSAGFYTYGLDKQIGTPLEVYQVRGPGETGEIITSTGVTVVKRVITSGRAVIERTSNEAVYSTFKFTPKEISPFKVKIRRVSTSSAYTYQIRGDLTLSSLTTRFDRSPILTDKRHVFIEVKIRATNQLNGSIQNLSAVCSSVLDVYDPDTLTWTKEINSNPAWVFCDLLTGQINKRAIAKTRLHLPSIVEWANFCSQIPSPPPSVTYHLPRFSTDFVLDYDTTLQSTLNSVSNAAQASLNIVDGKYGVLIDKLRTVPVQVFTPRNSWGFSSTRNYIDMPHALKIKYIDTGSNWSQNEQVVYYTGYTELNATVFETMDSFACANSEQAWRLGKYAMAQAILRQEIINISVDFEYLVCTRGDYVQITQDVMKAGGRPARVKGLVGNTIEIDDGIDTVVGPSYGYVFRGVGGIYTNTLTVVDSSHFTLNGTLPVVGDLVIIGEVGSIVMDCLVKSIHPTSDFSAQLTLVEKADAIYTAESSEVIPAYSPLLNLNQDSVDTAPGEIQSLAVLENTWRCNGSAYEFYILLDWDVPVGSAYEIFEIYVDVGGGYNLIDYTKETLYKYIENGDDLGVPHNFKILAVSSTGKKLEIGSIGYISATPLPKTTKPSDVSALYINVTGEVLQLDWPLVSDCDIQEYLIRFSPNPVSATWEASVPLLKASKNQTIASVQARTGTYLIKAIDFAGNESYAPALAITSIPNLLQLNVIDEINDFPTLAGSFDTSVRVGDTIILQESVSGGPGISEYYSEGFYYMENLLDLGDIYTVRLQALIEAEGYTIDDIMSNWTLLSDLTFMSHSQFSEWDAEIQYRATDSLLTMSSWTSLDVVLAMSTGVEDGWTTWRKLTTTGDFTGRVFQFRVRLISNKASVSPRVISAIVKADMTDRVDSYNNQTAIPSGSTLTYSKPFKGPGTTPNIQISIDNAQSGDYWTFTSKTLSSFTIIFYDKTDTAVTRQYDAMVKGYGSKSANTI